MCVHVSAVIGLCFRAARLLVCLYESLRPFLDFFFFFFSLIWQSRDAGDLDFEHCNWDKYRENGRLSVLIKCVHLKGVV